MKKIMLLAVLVVFLTACGTPAVPTEPALSQNQLMETALVQAVGSLTAAAPSPTETIIPNATPEALTTQTLEGEVYAWNYLASQESGGVVITIARVLLTRHDANPKIKESLATNQILSNKPVIMEVIFIVENKTDKMVSVYTNQGKILAGSEQINMLDFAMAGSNIIGTYSGDILPGAKLLGGIWVGFERVSIEEINSVTIFIDGPSDAQSFSNIGPDYNFVLDLSERKFEEMPAELR
jgi:uncharacterized lipoprotein YajG